MNPQPTIAVSESLRQITEKLQNRIPTGAIFVSTPNDGRSYVTLIMDPGADELAGEMYEDAEAILQSYPGVVCRIFEHAYAVKAAQEGNLYFIRHCALGQCIYSKPECEAILLSLQHDLETSIKNAAKIYGKSIKRANAAYSEFPALVSKEDFVQAALVLHLVLRELYRIAACFLAGKGTVAASLYLQQAFIAEFAPTLSEVFSYGDEFEKQLLLSIEETYDLEYGNCQLSVSETQVIKLKQKLENVWRDVDSLFSHQEAECLALISSNYDPAPVILPVSPHRFDTLTDQPDSLAMIIKEMISLAAPDAIMMHTGQNEGESYSMLTVILNYDYDDLGPTSNNANSIIIGHRQFRYRIFTRQYAQNELGNGSLYFMNCLMFGTVVFGDTALQDFAASHLDAQTLLKKAAARHDEILENVKGFRDGAAYYAANGNFTQAAFAIRQAVEALFRWIEYCTKGHEEKIRRYYDHQTEIRGFVDSIGELFTVDGNDERALMRLFDDVYRNPEENMDVSREEYELFAAKATKLERIVNSAFMKIRDAVSRRIFHPTGLEVNVLPQQPMTIETIPAVLEVDNVLMDEVVQVIVKFLKLESIYCFGQKVRNASQNSALSPRHDRMAAHVHYYLLIVSDDRRHNLIADCADLVRTQTRGRCTVTLLIHKRKQLLYTLPRQQHFFWHILQYGKRVYHDLKAVDLVIEKCPLRDIKASQNYWRRRDTVADMFLEAATADISDEGQGQMAMLNLVAEHVCLGLIEVYLGYRPCHFALGYLSDLVAHFCTLPSDLMPRETAQDKKLFKLLSTGVSNLRRSEFKDYRYMTTDILQERVSEFYKKSVMLVENELDRLSLLEQNVAPSE